MNTRRSRTFVSLTGPAGNLGDALLRRAALEWALGASDDLILYVGDAPDVWLRQLRVPPSAVVLRTKRSVARWLWLLATAPRRPLLVFEPGEVPLDRGNALRELVFLAETIVVRLKGGVVVRPPRGIRAPTEPARWIHARAARLSQLAFWRDAASAQLAGGSRVVPDLGFGVPALEGDAWADRQELIVSLRGARRPPDHSWLEVIRATAAKHHLRIRTVVQVREDEARSREIADELGGEFEPWGDRDAVEQESLLRARYGGAKLVISDRFHVLVLAALAGAVPVELVARPTDKVTAAFATIGFHELSLDAGVVGEASMRAFLDRQLRRGPEIRARVAEASRALESARALVRTTVRKRRS